MKKLLLAVCLLFGGATLVSAQEDQTPTSSQSQTQTTQDQDQDRQQISVSELPEAVTAKLESQDFSGWTVGNAYKKMDDANQEIYIVELKQGAETKKVKFDRDGNKLEKGEKHEGDKAEKSQNYRDDSDASQDEQSTEQSSTESNDQSTESTDQADNSGTEKDPQ